MVDVLTIEPDEAVERILARLARVGSRQACLYLPKANAALRHRLPMMLLRRTADDLGLNLTIVTRDSATRVMAGHAGLRVAWRLDGDWRLEIGDKEESALSPISNLQSPMSTLVLSVALLAFGLTLAVLILPQATIVVTPLSVPLETQFEILADPGLTAVDAPGHRIPARRLEVTLDRTAREPTSARTDVPDEPARGTVVFVNQSESEVVIPAGSVVTTSGGAPETFTTQETVTLPGPAGTTARARIEAVEPGLAGNVPAYTVNGLDPGLGLPVAVVNDRPMSGGTVRRVGLVTQAERERVRDALFDRTRQEALQMLKAQVHEGETLVDDSVDFQVVDESFSEQAEAVADVITVDLTVRAAGTAVRFEQARQLAEEVLHRQIPAGQLLAANSLATDVGPAVVVESGLVQLQARATATTQTQIKKSDIKNAVRGRPIEDVAPLLYERFPLTTAPTILVSRAWLGRMPWLPMRIDVIIRDGSTLIGEIRIDETNHGFGRGRAAYRRRSE